jgi:hypothetical protein
VTINQLRKRLDRVTLPRASSVAPNPILAAQWNNSTGARLYELRCKIGPLTRDEHLERAHLEACQDAWRRRHYPDDVDREGTAGDNLDEALDAFKEARNATARKAAGKPERRP